MADKTGSISIGEQTAHTESERTLSVTFEDAAYDTLLGIALSQGVTPDVALTRSVALLAFVEREQKNGTEFYIKNSSGLRKMSNYS